LGSDCIAAVSHEHWKTTTFIAGLCNDAETTPVVADGPMNGALFLAYVRDFLCPALHPGDVVIADNLSSHKIAGVRQFVFHLDLKPPIKNQAPPAIK
jgi:hypothetical protein